MNARVVFHAIRRRPITLIGLVVFTAMAAAGVWFLLPLPKVTTEAVFHIAAQTPAVLTPSSQGRLDFNSYKQSQLALVKRRLTLNSALKQPDVSGLEVIRKAEPDPITWLDKNLKVESKLGSELMRVSLEGENGDELKTLLSAVTKAYLDDVEVRENGGRQRHLTDLVKIYESRQEELKKYQNRIDTIAQAIGSKEGPTLASMDAIHQEELRVATREHTTVRDQLGLAELEVKAFEDAAKPGFPDDGRASPSPSLVPDAVIDEELRKDTNLQQLEADVALLRRTVAETEGLYEPGKSPPRLQTLKEQLKKAEEKRDRYRTERRPQLEAAFRDNGKRSIQLRREEANKAVEQLKKKEVVARSRLEGVQKQITDRNRYRIELENLQKSIEHTGNLASRLAKEIEEEKVELGAPLRVTMTDGPYIVPGIEGSRRLKYTLIISGVVFALGFIGLVGWEYRSRRVTHTDEVTSHIGVRLLGTVPPTIVGTAGHLDASAALVEAVDTARTMLLHTDDDGGGLRTVLVTSATAGEGKTSLAGHLAISLARAGFRTLFVDGDFHSPSVHRLFALPPGPGLCELLRGQVTFEKVVRPSPLPGLSVLSAGEWDLAARQALVGDRWRQAKQLLEGQFDYVVVDTAPLLLVADTLLLAKEVDGVVLSVLLGVSQVAHVTETADRLQSVKAKLRGAVVNGVWHKAYRQAQGYTAKASAAPVVA